MIVTIRQETEADYSAVFKLTEEAFRTLEISDHQEQFLVERLRTSNSFIPELSMVACTSDGKIVGHILLTKIKIKGEGQSHESLVLAPISVLPEFQNQGIGSKLIEAAHKKAKEMGFGSVVLVGHENYYPRFGYELCSKYEINMPIEAPEINCMVKELLPGALRGVSGTVVFDPAFGA
ncbi:GNAT family N-acetyltransferase [Mangrovibacterium lignilyticum]|uniref:GNAT family N-acetyltransferase n=1 Tax=Mangrovibacterium lignilyticum TaxID=2668052 RepID=UPI0013D31B97|nr:N-acetyltransferase [Mangrovibacterium lignilyticum]